MRRLIACICCGILWYSLRSQDIQGSLSGIKGLEAEISGSCWVWSDQVLRVHHSDTLFFDQSFLQLGSIHSVDAYNPLKALIFFKDQGQLLWVDNRAAAISPNINLLDLGLEQASAIAASYDNGIWVATGQDNSIVRLNQNLNIELKVPNIHRLTSDPHAEIGWMLEHQNRLFVLSTSGVISMWDIFGGLIATYRIRTLPTHVDIQRKRNGIAVVYSSGQLDFQAPFAPFLPVEKTLKTSDLEGFFIDWQKDTYQWHSNPDKK